MAWTIQRSNFDNRMGQSKQLPSTVCRGRQERTGLGEDEKNWSTPYWWVDGGMAAMSILVAAESDNLGSLFFGIFSHEDALKKKYSIPEEYRAVGTIAIGHPAKHQRASKSTSRRRASLDELIF